MNDDAKTNDEPIPAANALTPSAGAARGQRLLALGRQSFPHMYGSAKPGDPEYRLVLDAVLAAIAEVAVDELPDALGKLLGAAAAEALTDREVEGEHSFNQQGVWRLKAALAASVDERESGD